MGCYDEIKVPCPKCGEIYIAQSKGGECLMEEYELDNCPADVLSDVNRHAPFECEKCGTVFRVNLKVAVDAVVECGQKKENENVKRTHEQGGFAFVFRRRNSYCL